MATVRSRGIIMLPTLFLVAAVFVQSAGAQNCGFPSEWMFQWWRANEVSTNSRIFRRYGLTFEKNLRQVGTGALVEYSSYACEEELVVAPYMYYVRRDESDIGVEDCVKGYSDNTVVTDARLLVMSSASTGTTGFKAEQCESSAGLTNAQVNIYVRYPFDFSTVTCPFPTGRYLISLNTVNQGENKCLGDRDSYGTVSADGKITFETCLTGNSYETPFKGAELECVGDLAPTFIKSTAINGNVVIMAHKTGTDNYNFYTVRYQIASQGAVLMSLQGSTSGKLQPDSTKTFTNVGVIDSNFDYSFLMQPANCANDNIKCENQGTCRDNSDGTIGFTCDCLTGFAGDYCETDINDCPSGECSGNGKCTDLVNDYKCDCDAGYIGKDCETRDYCHNDPCGDHGSCRSLATNYQCTCDGGWSGANCDTQQFCYNKPCQNGGICNEQSNGYICSCQAGYTGTNCQTYQYCYDTPCVFGSCREGTGTYICTCQAGYAGSRCDRVLQCFNNPCKNGGVCKESANGQSYTCDCPAGFTDPMCSTVMRCYNHACLNGATCVEEGDSYMCRCPPGYTGWNCGTELHCANRPCKNGECIEESNTYSCNCQPGWMGYNCDTADLCDGQPCRNGAECVQGSNGMQCLCKSGYTGTYCEISPGGCNNNPCLNGGQCQNGVNGGYTCNCVNGWSGQNCQTPSGSSNCVGVVCRNDGTCQPRENGYVCSCLAGYDGTNCEIDKCNPNPCSNGGVCSRQEDFIFEEGYSCTCTPEWGGPTCKLEGGCNAETCDHGNCEIDNMCKCDDGWQGDKCDEEAAAGFNWQILVIVLVILLVLVFIILAILVCVCCVMRNNGAATEAKPKPGPVTPAGPAIREIIIPPQSVQVVDVSKKQPPPMIQAPPVQAPQQQVVAKPSTITTRAMFMSDNPQKLYQVNDPLGTTYAVPPQNPYYSRPQAAPQVKYVGALQPSGTQGQKPDDIDANVYPDVEASDYIKFGANALTGSKS